MQSVPVSISWQGTKVKNLPEGNQYITVSKFKEDLNWKNEAWSIVLEFELSPKLQGNPTKGKAHFLMKNGPQERLQTGCQFELYEGESLVAKVIVE
jgi:hypothetical protein